MASFFAPGEPYYNSSEEVVDISSTYSSGVSSGVTLTYNPSTGFQVRNGRVKNITITVESYNGDTYTVTRLPNGDYQSSGWFTHATRRR